MAGRAAVAHLECPPGLVEVLDYVRRHGSCTRAELVQATSTQPGAHRTAADGARRVRPRRRGRRRPVHGRARAAHRTLPRGRRPARGGPRRDAHRRRGRRPRGRAARARRRADRHRRRPRRRARPRREAGRGLRGAARPAPGLGIGVGVPGPVEFDAGRPVAPPIMPGWDGYRRPRPLRAATTPRCGSTTT